MSAYAVDMNIVQEIYAHMGDNYSKDMFGNRLLYSLTGDNQYIKKVIKMTKEGTEFYQKLEDEKRKKVIFSAGIWGQEIARSYPDVKFECFVDNNTRVVRGGGPGGYPLFRLSNLKNNTKMQLLLLLQDYTTHLFMNNYLRMAFQRRILSMQVR